jgi:hypothetical protein
MPKGQPPEEEPVGALVIDPFLFYPLGKTLGAPW